jgi:hypothetical protein
VILTKKATCSQNQAAKSGGSDFRPLVSHHHRASTQRHRLPRHQPSPADSYWLRQWRSLRNQTTIRDARKSEALEHQSRPSLKA